MGINWCGGEKKKSKEESEKGGDQKHSTVSWSDSLHETCKS